MIKRSLPSPPPHVRPTDRPSVRSYVCPYVHPSVRSYVCPYVHPSGRRSHRPSVRPTDTHCCCSFFVCTAARPSVRHTDSPPAPPDVAHVCTNVRPSDCSSTRLLSVIPSARPSDPKLTIIPTNSSTSSQATNYSLNKKQQVSIPATNKIAPSPPR